VARRLAIDIANKDSFQQIHAAWLYEFAELENVVHGRAESRLKAWLTSTHDMFRAPYARSVTAQGA
jgi:predicted P-loop ATPase